MASPKLLFNITGLCRFNEELLLTGPHQGLWLLGLTERLRISPLLSLAIIPLEAVVETAAQILFWRSGSSLFLLSPRDFPTSKFPETLFN